MMLVACPQNVRPGHDPDPRPLRRRRTYAQQPRAVAPNAQQPRPAAQNVYAQQPRPAAQNVYAQQGSAHNINAPSAYGAHQPHAGAHVPMGVPASAHAGAPGYAVPAAAAPPAAARPPVDPLTQNPDQLFASTDSDRSGRLDLQELQRALYQGGFPNFSKTAAKLMIGMFDRERKHIDRANFMALWKYLCDWKKSFDSFDKDRSGSIDQMELANAIQGFDTASRSRFTKKLTRGSTRTATAPSRSTSSSRSFASSRRSPRYSKRRQSDERHRRVSVRGLSHRRFQP